MKYRSMSEENDTKQGGARETYSEKGVRGGKQKMERTGNKNKQTKNTKHAKTSKSVEQGVEGQR